MQASYVPVLTLPIFSPLFSVAAATRKMSSRISTTPPADMPDEGEQVLSSAVATMFIYPMGFGQIAKTVL